LVQSYVLEIKKDIEKGTEREERKKGETELRTHRSTIKRSISSKERYHDGVCLEARCRDMGAEGGEIDKGVETSGEGGNPGWCVRSRHCMRHMIRGLSERGMKFG